MKDIRVKSFSVAVARLAEALEAKVRVQRWTHAETIPEQLSGAAAELSERLEVAKRLAAQQLAATGADAAKVAAMRTATDRLLLAYGAYEASLAENAPDGAMALENELGLVRSETGAW